MNNIDFTETSINILTNTLALAFTSFKTAVVDIFSYIFSFFAPFDNNLINIVIIALIVIGLFVAIKRGIKLMISIISAIAIIFLLVSTLQSLGLIDVSQFFNFIQNIPKTIQ